MNIQTQSTQSFRGLDFSKLNRVDRQYFNKNRKAMENLAKKYEIKISSDVVNNKDAGVIGITVKKVADGMDLIQKTMRKSTYRQASISENNIVEQTKEAIKELKKQYLVDAIRKRFNKFAENFFS